MPIQTAYWLTRSKNRVDHLLRKNSGKQSSDRAASAMPALKPNHPTHSKHAPMKLSTRLCGGMGCFGYPVRLPKYSAHTSAETPEEMCTTVPPAKSSVGNFPPSDAFSSPPLPHTICASGA